MRLQDFWYSLPSHLIAQTPLESRHDSRLMVYDRKDNSIRHSTFRHIRRFLLPGDVLVLNTTRVIPARIYARKKTGGRAEILLLRKMDDTHWQTLVGGKRLQKGSELLVAQDLRAWIEEELDGSQRIVRFSGAIEPFLPQVGNVPLPPYIHAHLDDPERYQTVYAKVSGSAAAPTAGLHFTPALLEELSAHGVELCEITLHVGLDTFAPVTEEHVEEHKIHREWCQVPQESADRINIAMAEKRRVIAVGTTSARALESAGKNGQVAPFSGETDLFIIPGYRFKIVDALLTNFHLPGSTLLMMVSAFADREKILACYQDAIRHAYRFYSFGDAMLIT